MVVGAADESDWDIYQRMTQLYGQWGFKRVYYQPFRPARYTPLEEHPATPMMRAHRLYQTDWLSRIYGYSAEELQPAFDPKGHLSMDVDPKLQVALDRLWGNIVDVNHADYKQLLRVPGVGPTSAERIVKYRAEHRIDTWRDLQAMGVVVKRAKAFVGFNGYKPEQSRQLKMDFTLGDKARTETMPGRELPVASAGGGCTSCVTSACGSCPIAGLRAASPVLSGAGGCEVAYTLPRSSASVFSALAAPLVTMRMSLPIWLSLNPWAKSRAASAGPTPWWQGTMPVAFAYVQNALAGRQVVGVLEGVRAGGQPHGDGQVGRADVEAVYAGRLGYLLQVVHGLQRLYHHQHYDFIVGVLRVVRPA